MHAGVPRQRDGRGDQHAVDDLRLDAFRQVAESFPSSQVLRGLHPAMIARADLRRVTHVVPDPSSVRQAERRRSHTMKGVLKLGRACSLDVPFFWAVEDNASVHHLRALRVRGHRGRRTLCSAEQRAQRRRWARCGDRSANRRRWRRGGVRRVHHRPRLPELRQYATTGLRVVLRWFRGWVLPVQHVLPDDRPSGFGRRRHRCAANERLLSDFRGQRE